MGIWKKLFGGDRNPAPPPAVEEEEEEEEEEDEDEDFDAADLIAEFRKEGPAARAGDVGLNSSPKEVCRYVFVRLVAGTSAARLRQDLVGRGFSGKVADAYIALIQGVMFKGR